MTRSRKFLAGLALGLAALALIAGLALTTLAQSTASAAPANQTAPATSTTTPGTGATKADKGQYRAAFIKAFATQLGVDEGKLNSSYTAAVGSTVDQAVKDGKLTQAQADKIKNAAKNGPQFNLGHKGKTAKTGKASKGEKEILKPAFEAAATTLGYTDAKQLKAELKTGKSIADVAAAKNVAVSKVKDAMLAAVKTQLDAAVKSGKLTQAQADKIYQAAPARLDKVISHKYGQHK